MLEPLIFKNEVCYDIYTAKSKDIDLMYMIMLDEKLQICEISCGHVADFEDNMNEEEHLYVGKIATEDINVAFAKANEHYIMMHSLMTEPQNINKADLEWARNVISTL